MGTATKVATADRLSANENLDEEIERGRLYVASSHISRAVVRRHSREELLQEVVRVLVDVGKFAAAFISWHDPATHELVPVARYGDTEGHVDRIRSFADDSQQSQGSAGAAFRKGVPSVCNDLLKDPAAFSWRDVTGASGWRAAAAFPIVIGGIPRGVLSVHSVEPDAFGPGRVGLLQEVTIDVAFGLERLEAEEQRRVAEAAFSTSEHHLKLAMEAAALGTWDWDLRTGKMVWDGHHERMFGFEPGEFEGTYADFEKRVHPDDLPKLNRAMETALVSRGTFCQEFRVVWPDESEHWIYGRGVFHYGDSGEPHRMCGAVLDITDRKRVEAALRESEERLRQAVRVSHIGIFDHDHIMDTTYWSPQQRVIHGWGADEPVFSETGTNVVHPAERARIAAAVARAHDPAGDGRFDVDYRLMLRDGSVRWTSTRSQTFFAGEGDERHPVRTVGAVRDITQQKQAESDQKKLATLVARSRDFIAIATLEGRIVYANDAAMTLVGLQSIEDACRKTIFDFFADSDRGQARDAFHAGLLNKGYWSGESRLRHFETGKLIDVEITAFQICDDNGSPLYFAAVTRDITERRRAETERAKLEEQLFQAQKMESIGRLAGSVAHDFNNLLTVINGYTGLLLSDTGTASPRTILGEILKAGERATGLTRQLLAFSRKQALQPRVLDLNRVVEEMRPMLERLVGEDVEISVALHQGGGNVHADPHQLEQVIMNLVANARDAMPGGGKLLIETAVVERDDSYARAHPGTLTGRHIMLAVSDSGVGMDEETQQRIFEPFFTTKGTAMGTGLGLSTVQGIVTQSGGQVDVYSEPGHGTTFKIYLPALDQATADIEEPAPARAVGGRETVLVVEDQVAVREFAVAALKTYGYRVLQAESAGEALSLCENEGRIDLVLTDVVMPSLSGRNLADSLRQRRPGIKVLFMSGYTENRIVHHGVLDEDGHFIEKPFSPEDLARKVRAVLGPPAPGARILVADDEPGVRGFLRTVLEEEGYEVIEAADGKEALRQALAHQVDLVTTDLIMLEQEGIDALRALRRDLPGVGLIAISGAYEGKLLEMAKFLEADAVLSKPVSAEVLLASVEQALKPRD